MLSDVIKNSKLSSKLREEIVDMDGDSDNHGYIQTDGTWNYEHALFTIGTVADDESYDLMWYIENYSTPWLICNADYGGSLECSLHPDIPPTTTVALAQAKFLQPEPIKLQLQLLALPVT